MHSLFILIATAVVLASCNHTSTKVDSNSGSSYDEPFEKPVTNDVKATSVSAPAPTPKPVEEKVTSALSDSNVRATTDDEVKFCIDRMNSIPGAFEKSTIASICKKTTVMDDCTSEHGDPIFQYQRDGSDKKTGKRILSISLIHGDEHPSGGVNRAWIQRLDSIEPRNTWRVIPIVNPDGMKAETRYNSHKVDLNRNFPSKDWDELAQKYWAKETKKDPRRYPGDSAGSERETRCIMKQIAEFKPDFVISIHTPLGVLDFDGPHVKNPGFHPLPWVGLGNYPGSLGRYLWLDRKVPVLTIELKGNKGIQKLADFDKLQDISGTIAIQAGRLLQTSKN